MDKWTSRSLVLGWNFNCHFNETYEWKKKSLSYGLVMIAVEIKCGMFRENCWIS